MDAETEEQIRKVQKFSRYARAFCMLMFVVLAIGAIFTIRNIAFGPTDSAFKADFGAYTISADHFVTLAAKAWGLVFSSIWLAVIFKGIFHLYALFGDFLAGRIYTKGTVRHIRQLGLIALASALLQIVLPMISLALLATGVIDEASVTRESRLVIGSTHIPGFITAGLILLASWIMDVGRKTRDEADELRREAELVV